VLTVDEARGRVLATVGSLPAIEVDLDDAIGLVAADDVVAPHPLPRFDNSSMDGYAVRAGDVTDASEKTPVSLRLIGESKAGAPSSASVSPGTAIRIMTGAEVPDGADAIVIVEETTEEEDTVMIRAAAGPYIRRAGEDLAAGAVAVPSGAEIDAGALALLTSCGVEKVQVHRRPKVALLVTGDELVGVGEELGPGRIRDSNSIALKALVRDAGGEVSFYARVPDDLDEALRIFDDASRQADLVISSGGVAVGRYDVVRDVVQKLGRIDLWRVAMQPGKPVVLGWINEVPFLGLPGNPVSVHVSFEQFVRPAIRKQLGHARLLRGRLPARLTEDIGKVPGRLHFVRVRLSWDGDVLEAAPTGAQGSHIQSSLVSCDGLAHFPRDADHLPAGSEVTVEIWTLPDG
jgi:molybdopterin molybdotransferase